MLLTITGRHLKSLFDRTTKLWLSPLSQFHAETHVLRFIQPGPGRLSAWFSSHASEPGPGSSILCKLHAIGTLQIPISHPNSFFSYTGRYRLYRTTQPRSNRSMHFSARRRVREDRPINRCSRVAMSGVPSISVANSRAFPRRLPASMPSCKTAETNRRSFFISVMKSKIDGCSPIEKTMRRWSGNNAGCQRD
jgi:hypothetical protein